mmetsp:Transcript_109005/g.305092  ORF Transcript_109005/g.305092 Transcript_109005/m.305092 type:complete len:363 (-) Transcript_109005:183-1271(-)
MEGREDQGEQHHHGMGQHPMHQQPVYGYAMGPSWGGQQMMHHVQMHPGHGYPHLLHHHMDGVPLPPGIPGLGASTDPLEAVLGPFPCARLRSLPYDATLEDILVLFQGLVVIDVLLMGAGEAFVIFANPMDYQMALQRDRQTIGRNYVEIYPGSRSEYYSAIASQQWPEQQRDTVLSLSESILGGSEKEQKPVGLDTSGSVWGSVGMPTPIQSLNAPQSTQSDGRPARGADPPASVPSSGSRGGPGRGNNAPPGSAQYKRSGGGIQVGDHTGFLRMRGLPFTASKEEIFKFFAVYNPILDTIVLTYRSDGRATGEAYVGFETPEDSKRAMDLHRKSMGNRYIELFLSNKEEHGRALTRFGNR